MDKAALLALADRVEALAEPDRDIDTEILWHVNKGAFSRGYWNAASGIPRPLEEMPRKNSGLGWMGAQCSARAYTASLDAAMTLVPDGKSWSVTDPANADGKRSVFGYPSRCHAQVEGGLHDYAATPALTLTAAALRARASQ